MCIFICVYIYLCVQRKGSKRIFAKTVHSDNLGNEIGGEGVYIWLYVCWVGYCAFISVLFGFFTSMYYFCNKNLKKTMKQ